MTAKGARPGIWYQFKVVATVNEGGKDSKIWQAMSPASMTRAGRYRYWIDTDTIKSIRPDL